jgi:hypothetical protein
LLQDAALRVLWLPLNRTHVAHRAARLWAWLTTLVGSHSAIKCGNVVNGDAASAKRMGHRRSVVIGKLSEVQVFGADVNLVGALDKAAGVTGAFDVVVDRSPIYHATRHGYACAINQRRSGYDG